MLAPSLVIASAAAVSAPRLVRLPAQMALLAYAAGLAVTAVRASEPGRQRDAAALPVVLAIMHLTWGAGFLVSFGRYGPPVSALARLAGIGRG
jgi:hypothetical protein